jgi:hypothetical protein
MNPTILNIAKAIVSINSSVVGCAISPKHVITPKDTLRLSRQQAFGPAAIHGYSAIHEIDDSPFAILESVSDLSESLSIQRDLFPRFSDSPLTLGEMLAVVKEGYFSHPAPRVDTLWGAKREFDLRGAIFLSAPCSLVVDHDGGAKLIVTTPRTTLPPGTPVFDSSGRLRGLVFVGLNNSRYDTPGDRDESSVFHILPLVASDVRHLRLENRANKALEPTP